MAKSRWAGCVLGVMALTLLGTATRVAAAPFVATYTFTGSAGNQLSEPVDSQPAGATLTDIIRGPGIIAENGVNSINSRAWTAGATPDLLNDFYEFSIAPAPGFEMDLTQLAFTERRSATGIRAFEIRTSLDAFATAVFVGAVPDNTANRRQTIPLGAAFEDLAVGVTFRIYGYQAENAALGTWRLGTAAGEAGAGLPQNLQLTGDLSPQQEAIPEPGSCALLGLGVLSLLGYRRLRRRAASS